MDDSSKMPWGKYEGESMANVPSDYLIWLWDNGRCSGEVKQYIKDNLDVLQEEAKRHERSKIR
jgi:uncharacterized protein (DUF3820 family)